MAQQSSTKMQNILMIIFCLFLLPGFSQDLRLFDQKYHFDWSKTNYQIIDEYTLEAIFPEIIDKPYRELKSVKEVIEEFHFVDIDLDGIDEIIYNGWSGGEGELVLILKKLNDDYKLFQTFHGRIVDLKKLTDGIEVIVLDYACCAGYIDHLLYIESNKSMGKLGIVRDYAKVMSEIDSVKPINSIKFTVQKETYNMRFSPKIESNLNPNDYPFELIQNQNISAVFSKGDKGTALAERVDDTGRIWWLVAMENAPVYPNTIFYQGNNDFKDYKPIGWMSSRYLKME